MKLFNFAQKAFYRNFTVFLIFFSINSHIMAQESLFNQFRKLHYPVKWWVITHPFTVKKAFVISATAKESAIQNEQDPHFDGDYAGGQVDAYRHGFWMSMLARDLGERRARSLGKAYEKSNYIDFKKKILEDKYLSCIVSSQMDLHNNEQGIKIGLQNENLNDQKLSQIVKIGVLKGDFVVIKKNSKGQFLDSKNKIIPDEEHLGKWYSSKTLVPSNYERP